ncbi:MAG: hypothetical protein SXA11_19660 [Cyanobacteriota bacterium]|nr:hypothetical protein [Cyanobacteriota bacterium]
MSAAFSCGGEFSRMGFGGGGASAGRDLRMQHRSTIIPIPKALRLHPQGFANALE